MQEMEEGDAMENTMGTMLRQLGIDPATLGWSDEEAMFVEQMV
jgi:hypothetical protein